MLGGGKSLLNGKQVNEPESVGGILPHLHKKQKAPIKMMGDKKEKETKNKLILGWLYIN